MMDHPLRMERRILLRGDPLRAEKTKKEFFAVDPDETTDLCASDFPPFLQNSVHTYVLKPLLPSLEKGKIDGERETERQADRDGETDRDRDRQREGRGGGS